MSDLRVAIIGFGLAGSVFHAPLIAATAGLAVSAVVTSNPQRGEAVRRDHPDARLMTSVEELWESAADHDVVVIASPNDLHVPQARRALDLGMAVVVDKPLAPSAAEARELLQHADGLGRFLTVFHNRRWDSDQVTLRRLMSEGALGDVFRYESRLERWRPQLSAHKALRELTPSTGGGVLLDLGTHLVDQALVLFGPATDVWGEVDLRSGGVADDRAFVAIRHASGVHSHLSPSELTAAPGPRLRVLGTRAAYVVAEVDGQEDALREGRRPGDPDGWGVEPESSWGRLVAGDRSEAVASEPGAWPDFYAGLVRAVRDGSPPPVDPWDAVATLEVLDEARRDAASA
jgi:predicted dehydrogenase